MALRCIACGQRYQRRGPMNTHQAHCVPSNIQYEWLEYKGQTKLTCWMYFDTDAKLSVKTIVGTQKPMYRRIARLQNGEKAYSTWSSVNEYARVLWFIDSE